jgi:acetylglutamate kinase
MRTTHALPLSAAPLRGARRAASAASRAQGADAAARGWGGLTVVKIGGSLLEAGDAGGAALDQVAAAWERGEAILLVHGGGGELSRWLGRLGIESRFVDGQRVTTAETLPVALMVLGGLVNRVVVEGLLRRGVPAVGVTGADGGGTLASPDGGRLLGAVGRVVSVNPSFYLDLVAARRLPVVASLAFHPAHGWLNVNADRMAAALAAGLGARRLLLMTNVPGVIDAGGGTLPRLSLSGLKGLISGHDARDGMIPKLLACRAALRGRVRDVRILGAGGEGLRRALAGEDEGTRVVRDDDAAAPHAGRGSAGRGGGR